MLATRIRQKDGIFYFASCPAKEILSKVRFISRYYGEDEQIAAQTVPQNDEIAQFIARIERNDAAFQRVVSRAKVRSLKNFYETIQDKEAQRAAGEPRRLYCSRGSPKLESSGGASAGTRKSSLAQAPKSMCLQRTLQKGRLGLSGP